ncbi:hypothetical protein MTO96_017672 [Rhipicephalus appendiculatus]
MVAELTSPGLGSVVWVRRFVSGDTAPPGAGICMDIIIPGLGDNGRSGNENCFPTRTAARSAAPSVAFASSSSATFPATTGFIILR